MQWLAVGTGGFVGALARYGATLLVKRYSDGGFPLGTLLVNLIGCLVIGALMALVEHRPSFSPQLRLFLVVGLLGSFTTFSTFGHDTYSLLRQGALTSATVNVLLSVVLGLAAVVAGRQVVRLLLP